MKKNIFNKIISNPIKIPVIIYVHNLNIPDIKKSIFLIDKYINVEQILHHIKYKPLLYLDNYPNFDVNSLCLKTENCLYDDLDYNGYIIEDILIEELYEYEVNKDGFLYLILDDKYAINNK
jgi:hypothetical protein